MKIPRALVLETPLDLYKFNRGLFGFEKTLKSELVIYIPDNGRTEVIVNRYGDTGLVNKEVYHG